VTKPHLPPRRALPAGVRFLGGSICLDFANTTEQLRSSKPYDWLTSYAVLLAWSQIRGTLEVDTVKGLADRAARDPAAAKEAFERALAVRQEIRDFAATLADRKPAIDAVSRLNLWLEGLPAQPSVKMPRKGAVGRFELPGNDLDEPLWPILWSFTALSTTDDLARVRRCDGQGCGYYFVDVTLNRSRRFCSSAGCGNRARARRHYQRQRPGTTHDQASD